jgi:hypothetical protein
VLAATGPKGAPGMHGWRDDIAAAARGESKPENLLYIMFAHSEASQAKGKEFLGRFIQRQEGRDEPTSDAVRDAQYDAIVEWGIPDHAALQRLTGIESPTLVIPDARIRIYPDAAHGFLLQYPTEVAGGGERVPGMSALLKRRRRCSRARSARPRRGRGS